MSADLGSAEYEILVQIRDAINNLDRFEKKAKSTSENSKASFGRVAGSITGLASNVASLGFGFDNLDKLQLRVEQSAQKVDKAQKRVNDIMKAGKTNTEAYKIAVEDLRLAEERETQAKSDQFQNQVQLGLALTTFASSTLPNAISGLSRLFVGTTLATGATIVHTTATGGLTTALGIQLRLMIHHPLFQPLVLAAAAAGTIILATNMWGLRDAITGTNIAIKNTPKSVNTTVDTLTGDLQPALKSTKTHVMGVTEAVNDMNRGFRDLKKNDEIITDIDTQVAKSTINIRKWHNEAVKFQTIAGGINQRGFRPTDPTNVLTEITRFWRPVDVAHANALMKGQLSTEEQFQKDYEYRFKLLVERIKKAYRDRKDAEYKAYIDSVREAERASNLSQLRFDKLNPRTELDELSDIIGATNGLLGMAINLPEAVGGGSTGPLAKNIKSQLAELNRERNFSQTRTMGFNAKNLTAGLDMYFQAVKAFGITSFTSQLHGGGLAVFGGISQAQTNAINNSQANINFLKFMAAGRVGGRTGVNTTGKGGSVGSGGKRGKGRGTLNLKIRQKMIQEARFIDPDMLMMAELLGIPLLQFPSFIQQGRGGVFDARVAFFENARFNASNAQSVRDAFVNSINNKLTELSSLSGFSVAQVKVMQTTNQGRDDLTGIIDFNRRKNMITSSVA